jgi:hypothetical protein
MIFVSLLFGEFSGLLKKVSRRIRRTNRELALQRPEKRRRYGFRIAGLLIVHSFASFFYLGVGISGMWFRLNGAPIILTVVMGGLHFVIFLLYVIARLRRLGLQRSVVLGHPKYPEIKVQTWKGEWIGADCTNKELEVYHNLGLYRSIPL